MASGFSRSSRSEISSNVREIGAAIKLIEAETATAVRKGVRAALVAGGESTKDAIKEKAREQRLNRAADATTVKVSFAVRSGGVRIATNQKKAPMARPLERGSQGSGGAYNRHPVFGKAARVNQPTRPYFFAGAQAEDRPNEEKVLAAIDAACRAAGWHL